MLGSHGPQAPQPRGHVHTGGEADRSGVTVAVATNRIASVSVPPRLLRSDPRELAESLTMATNAALEDFRAEQAGEAALPDVDPLALAREMREIGEDLSQRMNRATNSIAGSVTELQRHAGISAHVPTMEFGGMFGKLADLLEAIGAAGDAHAEAVVSEAASPGGWVSASCSAGPRVVSLSIRPQAMRGTPELEDHVLAAVNAALDRLDNELRERRKAAGLDPEVVDARISELWTDTMAQLRAYGEGINDLMGSIRPR
ncbi:YbaB/EbfC family nucleoid-associated protein [Nonomuraea muscovyensis]|uniref:YbaB/EbfC family nucleoid-associated protein n=1 Tax=Nonomuraea muscovyensis TaxID=1124761 RepID=UPI0033F0470B